MLEQNEFLHVAPLDHQPFNMSTLSQLPSTLRRVLQKVPETAVQSSSSSSSQASSSRHTFGAQSPFLPRKTSSGQWHRPQVSARVWKKLFLMSNYGQDVPEGYVFPPGPKGRAQKLLQREQDRLASENHQAQLLEMAQQHFPPSTERVKRETQTPATSRNSHAAMPALEHWDRKAYLQHRGPYSGRRIGDDGSRAFKGHVHERKMPQRQAELQTRLSKMNMQYDAYNKVCIFPLVVVVVVLVEHC